ncbi:hypothetical protein EV363DRAFT_1582521 [Boletus edulis]|nr:hypothetical protein EV363DRAFT_1582521 [Boletus edulis]
MPGIFGFDHKGSRDKENILENELYGPDPYHLNFVFPVPSRFRRTNCASSRSSLAFTLQPTSMVSAEMFKHLPSALEHPADFLQFVEKCRRDENVVLFAAIDTTRPDPDHPEWEGSLAGLFGLEETDKTMLVTEIGLAIVLPAFQRTHMSALMPSAYC